MRTRIRSISLQCWECAPVESDLICPWPICCSPLQGASNWDSERCSYTHAKAELIVDTKHQSMITTGSHSCQWSLEYMIVPDASPAPLAQRCNHQGQRPCHERVMDTRILHLCASERTRSMQQRCLLMQIRSDHITSLHAWGSLSTPCPCADSACSLAQDAQHRWAGTAIEGDSS